MTTNLTHQEMQVVEKLAEAWNLFMKLPVEHAMDQDEFCRAIHVAQDKVLSRSGRRQMLAKAGARPAKIKPQLKAVE